MVWQLEWSWKYHAEMLTTIQWEEEETASAAQYYVRQREKRKETRAATRLLGGERVGEGVNRLCLFVRTRSRD